MVPRAARPTNPMQRQSLTPVDNRVRPPPGYPLHHHCRQYEERSPW
ncbi:hypothetical protein ACFFX0_32925 [Citricoccus parietis]|uniref:Uncharacterized protein n=1 Tax=Citricoccus parietis TaxID=592307 RepID=A0ABV5G9U9_9MICC